MSKADEDFVKSIDSSYSGVAELLGLTRQAISRGVKREDEDYFQQGTLSRILTSYEAKDPLRYRLARRSVAQHYPLIASEVFQLIDSRRDSSFAADVPGDYTIVTADFPRLMGELKSCGEQIRQVLQLLESAPGTLTLVVASHDEGRANRFLGTFHDRIDDAGQRLLVNLCQIDLSLFPTSLMRIADDFSVDIFIATNSGFSPLDSVEADRIKDTILRIQQPAIQTRS